MTQITILLRTTTYYLLIAICFRESKSEIQNYAGPEAIKSYYDLYLFLQFMKSTQTYKSNFEFRIWIPTIT